MHSEYFAIVAAVDAEFERNRQLHGDRIRCGAGCSQCCHQRFQITGLDAQRLADGVRDLDEAHRSALRSRAERYMEETAAGHMQLPCPVLQDGVCSLYEFRPVICHKFGMPLFNPDRPDRIFACELNFQDGDEIRDPDLIRIQTGIHENWMRLRQEHDEAGPTTIAHAILTAVD